MKAVNKEFKQNGVFEKAEKNYRQIMENIKPFIKQKEVKENKITSEWSI